MPKMTTTTAPPKDGRFDCPGGCGGHVTLMEHPTDASQVRAHHDPHETPCSWFLAQPHAEAIAAAVTAPKKSSPR